MTIVGKHGLYDMHSLVEGDRHGPIHEGALRQKFHQKIVVTIS
jgi:hypothetical protein